MKNIFGERHVGWGFLWIWRFLIDWSRFDSVINISIGFYDKNLETSLWEWEHNFK